MKTKEELLKIYSAYLPYELKLKHLWIKAKHRPEKTLRSWIKTLEPLDLGCLFPNRKDSFNWKPILYSMEMLTQEIEHKGEMFVPKKRLGFNENDILCLKAWGEYSGRLLHKDFEQLVEWNFNVFGLEESEYIKKETLNRSENPNS